MSRTTLTSHNELPQARQVRLTYPAWQLLDPCWLDLEAGQPCLPQDLKGMISNDDVTQHSAGEVDYIPGNDVQKKLSHPSSGTPMAGIFRTDYRFPVILTRYFDKVRRPVYLKFVRKHRLDSEVAAHLFQLIQYLLPRRVGIRFKELFPYPVPVATPIRVQAVRFQPMLCPT